MYPLGYFLPGNDHGSYEDPFNTWSMFLHSRNIQVTFVMPFCVFFVQLKLIFTHTLFVSGGFCDILFHNILLQLARCVGYFYVELGMVRISHLVNFSSKICTDTLIDYFCAIGTLFWIISDPSLVRLRLAIQF